MDEMPGPRVDRVRVTEEHTCVHLADGRVLGIPLAWSERLSNAISEQRAMALDFRSPHDDERQDPHP